MGQARAFDKGKRACVASPQSASCSPRRSPPRAPTSRRRRSQFIDVTAGDLIFLVIARDYTRPSHPTAQLVGCVDGKPNCALARAKGLIGRRVVGFDGGDFDPDVALGAQIFAAFAATARRRRSKSTSSPKTRAARPCASSSRGGKIQRRDGGAFGASRLVSMRTTSSPRVGEDEMRLEILAAAFAAPLVVSAALADIAPTPDRGPPLGDAGGLTFMVQSVEVEMGPANGPHYSKTEQVVVLTGCAEGTPNCALAKRQESRRHGSGGGRRHRAAPEKGMVRQILAAFADAKAPATIALTLYARAADSQPVEVKFARR